MIWQVKREFISKYRHTFTYGEFKLLPEGNSAGPWAGAPVGGVPWMGSGAFRGVLLRLTAGVACCTLGFEHLAPEIFPPQVAPLHLFIAVSKQRIGLNVWQRMWNSPKFLSTSCWWYLGKLCRKIFDELSVGRVGVRMGGGPRLTLRSSWKHSCLSYQVEVVIFF